MGQADWTECSDGLGIGSIDRGVTTGIARPNGGGNFVFAFNSLVTTQGAVALRTNQTNFNPTPANKGGSVRGAVQRGPSGGNVDFAPFLFIGLQGASVNDNAYILGLMDASPHYIALRKGALVTGIPEAAVSQPPTSGILRRSTATYQPATWHHLRLDMVVNLNGDVILKCFMNDLAANSVAAPSWVAIPGMTDFTDDALQINSGSAPYTSGRMGFGFYSKDVSRRGFFDHIECIRQL